MNQQLIEQAIRDKAVVEFVYSNHRRLVEPHVLGISGGTVQILGYQIGGSSSSGGALPEWRRFDLGKMNALSATNGNFAGRRPFPSGKHSAWDVEILVVAP